MALLALLLTLSGCARLGTDVSAAFCTDYESAWEEFAAVRADAGASREKVLDARTRLVENWDRLAERSDVPDDASGAVAAGSEKFAAAWNATATHERVSQQQGFANWRDYIANRCAESGTRIRFSHADEPIGPPGRVLQ